MDLVKLIPPSPLYSQIGSPWALSAIFIYITSQLCLLDQQESSSGFMLSSDPQIFSKVLYGLFYVIDWSKDA